MKRTQDTIAAIASPVGAGGIAIVRTSGPGSLAIARKVFLPQGRKRRRRFASYRLRYGHVVDPRTGRRIDEILLAVMRRPASYTREDVVEYQCHGGLIPARKILQVLLSQGARPAVPGEFTLRAFLNGRINLAQAEAVAEIVYAQSERALASALAGLLGDSSKDYEKLRAFLKEAAVRLEAVLEFPEENDVADYARRSVTQVRDRLRSAHALAIELSRAAGRGERLKAGARVALIGRTNVGKSSLLNRLLCRDRAMVSTRPGTTRDVVEGMLEIEGLATTFLDTAGGGKGRGPLANEAVRRAKAAAAEADRLLWIVDVASPLQRADRDVAGWINGRPADILLNKIDLPARIDTARVRRLAPRAKVYRVSAKTGHGIPRVLAGLGKALSRDAALGDSERVILSERQGTLLRQITEALERALARDPEREEELVAEDVRLSLNRLAEIQGETPPESILAEIFSRFCIGK